MLPSPSLQEDSSIEGVYASNDRRRSSDAPGQKYVLYSAELPKIPPHTRARIARSLRRKHPNKMRGGGSRRRLMQIKAKKDKESKKTRSPYYRRFNPQFPYKRPWDREERMESIFLPRIIVLPEDK